MMAHTSDERVKELKLAADTIKDMAEEIIGDNRYCMGWEITIKIEPQAHPVITIKKDMFPYKMLGGGVVE